MGIIKIVINKKDHELDIHYEKPVISCDVLKDLANIDRFENVICKFKNGDFSGEIKGLETVEFNDGMEFELLKT